MRATVFDSEIKVTFKEKTRPEISAQLKDFYGHVSSFDTPENFLFPELLRRELGTCMAVYLFYDHSCLMIRLEGTIMCKHSHAELERLKSAVSDEVDSIRRFAKENGYAIHSIDAKIYGNDTLLSSGQLKPLKRRILEGFSAVKVLAKLSGVLGATLTGLMLGADRETIAVVMLASTIGLALTTVVEALFASPFEFSRRTL